MRPLLRSNAQGFAIRGAYAPCGWLTLALQGHLISNQLFVFLWFLFLCIPKLIVIDEGHC